MKKPILGPSTLPKSTSYININHSLNFFSYPFSLPIEYTMVCISSGLVSCLTNSSFLAKFLRAFFSPVGVLLVGGLVHDYMYKYTACKPARTNGALLVVDQKRADQIFRDINIEVNGFYFMNYLAFWSLRIGGFVAWNGHRKRNAKIK